MAVVSGVITTWNMPNYSGELFTADAVPDPQGNIQTGTPFLTMIGGLSGGGDTTDNYEFSTSSEYDFPAASQPAVSEQASLTAPTASGIDRSQATNVTQIFHEAVAISYAKMSNTGRMSGLNTAGQQNNVPTEKDWQIARKLEKIARDVEYTFLRGTYHKAANVSDANKTRGMLELCSTGNTVAAGSKKLSKAIIDSLLREMATNGAYFRNMVVFLNAYQRQAFSNIYGYAPTDRNVGGVNIKTVETDFGTLGLVWNRFMPDDTILFADLSVIKPTFQPVPEKGILFYEELSKTGAAETGQLYGQLGLGHGPAFLHGSITGLATS